jgi:hypothetical protein
MARVSGSDMEGAGEGRDGRGKLERRGRLTSSSAAGGERWWVGGGDDPQPDPTSRSEPVSEAWVAS